MNTRVPSAALARMYYFQHGYHCVSVLLSPSKTCVIVFRYVLLLLCVKYSVMCMCV